MGTGETTRRLIEAYPDAWVIGLDSSPDMVFQARGIYDDVQLARFEDPLPDGPWDLVIGVLSIHHLRAEQKQELFRRVREQSRALVIGDVVEAEVRVTEIAPTTTSPRPPPTSPGGAGARSPGRPTTWRSCAPSTESAHADRSRSRDRSISRPMAVPKKRTSSARRDKRRANHKAAVTAWRAARAATARTFRTGSARPAEPTPAARSSPTKSPTRR